MKHHALGLTIMLTAALGGCGLKGALYLPEKSGEVVVRPAPATTAPATPAEPPVTPQPPSPPDSPPQDPPPGPDRG